MQPESTYSPLLRSREKRLAAVAFFLCALLTSGIAWYFEREEMVHDRERVIHLAGGHAEAIRRDIDRALSATYPLAAMIRQGNGRLENFEALANQILPYYQGASALVLAPNGVISQIIPKGNEKAIGLNLLKDPRRDKEAILARDSGALTLAGPFELVQGGLGATGRLPVYLGEAGTRDKFWGLVSVVIRFPDVLAHSDLGLLQAGGHAYHLWRAHPETGAPLTIARAGGELDEPVSLQISVPNANWTLSVAPANGWGDRGRIAWRLAVALLISLLLAGVTALLAGQFRQRRLLERQIDAATGDLRSSLGKARQLRERFRGYIDNAPSGVFVADETGQYIDVNPAACALVGYTREELCGGMSIADLAGSDDLAGYLAIFERVLEEGHGEVELLLRRKDGSRLMVSLRAVRLEHGSVMGFATDVTESRAIQGGLQALATRFSLLSGNEFYEAVCRYLAEQYALEHVFVGQLEEAKTNVRAVAGWSMGAALQPFSYALAGTPCSNVVKRDKAVYACRVQSLFPEDELLVQMGIESYAGASLFDKNHAPLGILVGLSQSAIAAPDLLAKMLDIFVESLSAEMQRTQAEVRMRQALVVFNTSGQGIMTTNAAGMITAINPAFSAITGYQPEEVIGKRPSLFKSGRHNASFYDAMWAALTSGGRWEGEVWNRRRDGEVYPQWLTISCVRDESGQIVEHVSMFSDITERKQQEEAIWRQANFDALTGLANRNLLADRLERALASGKRKGKKVGLTFLDLDGFKWINDTLGHDVGDELLVEVGRRLRACVRDQDTVARLGGDEFTAVIHDLDGAEDMLVIGEKLVGVLREPFLLQGASHLITGSVGITIYPDDGEDVQTLLKNADIAMYKAKQGGKNRFQFYARHMQIDARARMAMESDLRAALAGDQLILHYQPIVDTDSGELVGAEALVRWEHPVRGLVSPLEFIPVAEDSGLIVPIGNWVLRSAARQMAVWLARGYPGLRMSVNVSGVQFREANFSQVVGDILREFALPPGCLVLEITESVLMDGSAEAEVRMREIKSLGVSYALDDFGTGFSSLSYLKRFPVDIVKIDRSFVNDCPDDRNDAHLVEAIVNMAQSLDLRVTAEGVETEAQFDFLRDLGCDYLQGYLAGRPLPAAAFEILIERRQLLLPNDGASVEEARFMAALRQDDLDVDEWLRRLLSDSASDLGSYQLSSDWVYRGLNLRDAVRTHLDWRRRLGQFINGDLTAMGEDDAASHQRCVLGGLIAQYRDGNHDACFNRLDEVHRAFHRLAGQIMDDHLNGHRTLARRALMGSAFRKASRDIVVALVDCYRARLNETNPAA